MSYQQLTREQRYQIYALKKEHHTQEQIAANLSVHPSTISRELRRNRGQRGYRPKQADELAQARKQSHARPRISQQTWTLVETYLCQDWSPEQVSGWLAQEKKLAVSHERIYQYIYRDKQGGGTLYRHLRCQKKRRKRYGKHSRRGLIPNRQSIELRPTVVEQKKRLGDWEADTLIGKNHQQAILSLVERKSKFCLLKKVERNTAEAIKEGCQELMQPLSDKVLTITSDNGREFAAHEEIASQLEADFYFAHPYSSWERGLNENTNGLIRQYFPKGSDFSKITTEEVTQVMDKLNRRPRKTLGFRTPHQLFFKEHKVALTT